MDVRRKIQASYKCGFLADKAGSCLTRLCLAGPFLAWPCLAGSWLAGPCMVGVCLAGLRLVESRRIINQLHRTLKLNLLHSLQSQ